jgi:putative oxidoreductase
MLGAIFLVHLPHGFNISTGGIEYALTQLLVSIALLITGAGAYSLAGVLPPAPRKL